MSIRNCFIFLLFLFKIAYMINIGENLKKLRKQQGLSYRKLSKEVGISHTNLVVYEKNLTMPSLENAIKLCKFFNVPLEYLLMGEGSDFQYHDLELAQLFKEVDSMNEEDKDMVKSFIRKLIKNMQEREQLRKEAKE